jgi:hypothetical protein
MDMLLAELQGQRAQLHALQRDLTASQASIVDPETVDLLQKSVFALSDRQKPFHPIGVGFFVSGQFAVTAAHAIGTGDSALTSVWCKLSGSESVFELSVAACSGPDRDIALLKSAVLRQEKKWLELSQCPPSVGGNVVLAGFQIGIHEEIKDTFNLRLGVNATNIISCSAHHLLYSTTSFEGDSGSALALRNGKVVGIHQETVNQHKRRTSIDTPEDRLKAVEDSVDSLIRSASEGQIGLQAVAIRTFLEQHNVSLEGAAVVAP